MAKQKFKLHWASHQIGDGIGNAYGYTKHEANLRRYTKRIAELTPKAKAALTIISPEQYVNPPHPYINFLFTMFEGTTLPDEYTCNMAKADYLIAPSTWVKERFNQYFPKEKTFVVPHGVSDEYKFIKRALPGERGRELRPFMYLWAGAPNPRKGYEPIIVIWQKLGFQKRADMVLYLKTTRLNKVEQRGNVILDGRNITDRQMIKLYQRAHCFLSPHYGEGFSLVGAEAMRTGLPCIMTDYSGVTEYFNKDVGYPVSYTMADGEVFFPATKTSHKTQVAHPDPVEVFEKMVYVREHYDEALKVGQKASDHIASNFTWQKSARLLIDGIKERTC